MLVTAGADGGPRPTHEYDLGFEYDKTIAPNFGLGADDGWDILQTEHGKTATGFENLSLTAKYQAYVNAPHEFILSLCVVRTFGGTGTVQTGADATGSTAPTLYVGKGLATCRSAGCVRWG